MVNPEVQLFEDEFPLAQCCPKLNELRLAQELTDLTIRVGSFFSTTMFIVEGKQRCACAQTYCGRQDFFVTRGDVLLSMLRDDKLQVDNEEKVFDAIKRWVRPAGNLDEERIAHAPELLRVVRWSQTKHRFRKRLMENDDLIGSSTACLIWHHLPEMRERRAEAAAVALSDGRVVVFGGCDGRSSLASVKFCHLQADWSYITGADRSKGFWRSLEPMRTPRYLPAAVAFRDKIIVAGGLTVDKCGIHNAQRVVEVFHPPDAERPLGEWTSVADLLQPRRRFSPLVYKDRLYALGQHSPQKLFVSGNF
ncbi:unnamed protein product [Dibothriocephalus latus]|uniref:BACK domain-containing protein n=1 Tax=Dibothriocephalus latus TaxID=60516 RepID=A0A3P7LPW8_DIBLA|nr:unnamed protein product [Dibothriocephalus latus]